MHFHHLSKASKPRVQGGADKVEFCEESQVLDIHLLRTPLVKLRQDLVIQPGEVNSQPLVVVSGKCDLSGSVSGHVIAVGASVYLRSGASIQGQLILIDSLLDSEGIPWRELPRLKSLILPTPWTEVRIEAGESQSSSPTEPMRKSEWRIRADQSRLMGPLIEIDTRQGKIACSDRQLRGQRRFKVNGADHSDWFLPFEHLPITFWHGRVLAFGGSGASRSASGTDWQILGGTVAVVAQDGILTLGARQPINYDARESRLVAREAVLRSCRQGGITSEEGEFHVNTSTFEVQSNVG